MKIRKRHFEILIYLILFNLYRIYKKIIPKKNIKKRIAIQTPDMEGNLYAVSEELKKKTDIHFYWIAYENKKFLEKMKNKGEECYYDLDISKIPLFYNTNIFIGTPGMGNIPTKYFKPGKWVDLWHGIGFKGGIMKNFKEQINRFDITCITSEFFKNEYVKKGCDEKRIRLTGYARTDRFFLANKNKDEIFKKVELNKNFKIVLYAPTWEKYKGEKRILMPFNKNIFEWLKKMNFFCKKNKAYFIIRPHKLWENKKEEEKIRKYLSISNLEYIKYLPFDKYSNVEDLLEISNILVTDWSSIYSDFVLTGEGKETLFLDVPAPFDGGFNLGPKDRAGFLAKNNNEFFYFLGEILQGKSSSHTLKEKVIEKMYGKNKKYADGNASKRCVNEILKLI